MEILLLLSLLYMCAAPVSLLIWSGYRLTSLFKSKKHAEITFSPHELRPQEVVLAILTMVFKSTFKKTSGSNIDDKTSASHEMTLSSPFSITKEDVFQYFDAVDSPNQAGEVPLPTLALFLSAVTEPAMLLLLASPRCPISPLGAVNVRNRFEVLRPDLCQPHLFIQSHSAGLVAKLRNGSRTVKRGIEYDLEVSIMVPEKAQIDTSVELIPVFRQVFTMLEIRDTKTAAKADTASQFENVSVTHEADTKPVEISFSSNDPLKWAALCKDYNLIHLAGFAAQAFGFPGKLAHGNHIVAKALRQLRDDKRMQLGHEDSFFIEVQFKRPVVVPNTLTVQVQPTTNERTVSVLCSGRESVSIAIGPI